MIQQIHIQPINDKSSQFLSSEMLAQRNKKAILGICILEVVLLLVYVLVVRPDGSSSTYQSYFKNTNLGLGTTNSTDLIIIFAVVIGFLYLNNYKREYFLNIVGMWIIIVIFTVQIYVLFLTMFLSIKYKTALKPVINDQVLIGSMTPVAMITLIFVNLKAFLKLKDIITITLLGTFGFAGNQVLLKVVIEGYDFGGGLCVYLFGTIAYILIRMIGLPVRTYSKNNNSVPYTNNMALTGIIVSLIFFPSSAGGFIGFTNTFFCQIFAIIGYLIVQLNKTNTIKLQRVFELVVFSAITMSVGATFFQNIFAPSFIGGMIGVAHGFLGDNIKKLFYERIFRAPDPARIVWLFGVPAILAGVLCSIAISSYNIKSTNRMGISFPYLQILKDPLSTSGWQFLCIFSTVFISTITGGIVGVILRLTSNNNEVQNGDLIWDEQQQILGLEQHDDISEDPVRKQTPIYIPPRVPEQQAQPYYIPGQVYSIR